MVDVTQDGRIMCENEADHKFIKVNATPLTQEIERCTLCGYDRVISPVYESIDMNKVVQDLQDIMEPTPESDIKPELVWLGHFLGLDVYIDVGPVKGSKKHTDLARRLFKAQFEDMN